MSMNLYIKFLLFFLVDYLWFGIYLKFYEKYIKINKVFNMSFSKAIDLNYFTSTFLDRADHILEVRFDHQVNITVHSTRLDYSI